MTKSMPPSGWGDPAQQERWAKVLARTGVENVRARVAQINGGSASSMAIGTEHSMTKGFAEEWLAWQDGLRRDADEAHRASMGRWTKAAALGALVAAAAAVVAAVAAMVQLSHSVPR